METRKERKELLTILEVGLARVSRAIEGLADAITQVFTTGPVHDLIELATADYDRREDDIVAMIRQEEVRKKNKNEANKN